MRGRRALPGLATAVLVVAALVAGASTAVAAYHHMGEVDSDYFLSVHPEAVGTKLDSCTLCHRGGTLGKATLGSCEWCHYTYGYDAHGDIMLTLNAYGLDYHDAGSTPEAVTAIEGLDSDGDAFSNLEEIAALRYPGDAEDDPTKVEAPYRVYTLAEVEAMPAHTQFMLMNTHKSIDYYAEYTGVPVEFLLDDAGMLDSAVEIHVSAPDGFGATHPLDPLPGFYHVRGTYPAATFFYDTEADIVLNTVYGWCDYRAASATGREHGDAIDVEGGLKMLLAYKYEGDYLTPGSLNEITGKLDGEGPFRLVPPQRIPGPPDQKSTSAYQSVIWPFDSDEDVTDHNAGFSSKCVTVIKVGPLPEGTTDINTLEAGWEFIRDGKVVVYGAIDPIPTVLEKTEALQDFVLTLERADLRGPNQGTVYAHKLDVLMKQIDAGAIPGACDKIVSDLLPKVDGAVTAGAPDGDDWVLDPIAQQRIYWALNELLVLLSI